MSKKQTYALKITIFLCYYIVTVEKCTFTQYEYTLFFFFSFECWWFDHKEICIPFYFIKIGKYLQELECFSWRWCFVINVKSVDPNDISKAYLIAETDSYQTTILFLNAYYTEKKL